MKAALIGAALCGAALTGLLLFEKRAMPKQQIEVLRTSFREIDQMPDPAEINTAGKWYLMNHLSSPLIEYDHKNSSFKPLIAKSWEIDGARYVFHIDPAAKFSDGSSIQAEDVAKSLQRILAKKKSTHFPLWKHVRGCEKLTDLNSSCDGLTWDNDKRTVEVTLVGKSDSFLLQISSPEAGIWSAKDLDPTTLNLKPQRFSGPYALRNLEVDSERNLVLDRNSYSPIQAEFPSSPKKILVKSMSRAELEKGIAEGTIDVFIGDYIPFNAYRWDDMNLSVHYTTPSSIIYFFGMNSDKRIGRDLLNKLAGIPDKRISSASTFLPFAPQVALTEQEVKEAVPEKSARHLKVAVPGFYLRDETISFMVSAAREIGIQLEITKIGKNEIMQLLRTKDDYRGEYDFLIGNYVASERYPAVQLRYLTRARTSPVDLGDVEQPDQDPKKISRLKEYQKWLLKSQTVVPIYFLRTHIVAAPNINLGDQPTTDADLQLWRLTRRAQ